MNILKRMILQRGEYAVSVDKNLYIRLYKDGMLPYGDCGICNDENDHHHGIYIADNLISFINGVIYHLDDVSEINIKYNGNPYWFFHDLIHARDDCEGGVISVDSYSEEKALYLGAKLAAENNIDLNYILTALINVRKEFKNRFNYDTDAIDKFVSHLRYDSSRC